MRVNALKTALVSGHTVTGTWLTLADPTVGRFLTRAGFDFVGVDLEHQLWNGQVVVEVIAAVAGAGGVPLVRVPANRPEWLKLALDSGAFGVIVPMVNSPEEAAAAVAACRYPPTGQRSVGGHLHALNRNVKAADYFAQANADVVVILQCEHARAVANFAAVYGQSGVDAVLVGPADLAASLRTDTAPEPDAEPLIATALAESRRLKLPAGIHTFDPADLAQRHAAGWNFFTVASDAALLTLAAQTVLGG